MMLRLGSDCRARGGGGLAGFVGSSLLALAGFFLIWAPWTWLMVVGALTSLVGTVLMCRVAWRLAVRRWRSPDRGVARDAGDRDGYDVLS